MAGVVSLGGGGKVRGERIARDQDVACPIQRQRGAEVRLTPPHKGTVEERITAGRQLEDKDIGASVVAGVVSAGGDGKVCGLCIARDHDVACPVQRQRLAPVLVTSPHKGAEEEGGGVALGHGGMSSRGAGGTRGRKGGGHLKGSRSGVGRFGEATCGVDGLARGCGAGDGQQREAEVADGGGEAQAAAIQGQVVRALDAQADV